MEWRAVDCPTGDKHKLEYLFCVPDSCNIENAENTDRFGEIFNPYWFAVNVRNSRIPIICVSTPTPHTHGLDKRGADRLVIHVLWDIREIILLLLSHTS
jgi:hypothetical protein